jgi:hypothetical protein
MTARPYENWTTAELEAALRQLRPYLAEHRRRQKAEEDEARLRRLESVLADIQQGIPADNLALRKKSEKLSRRLKDAEEIAGIAFRGRLRLEKELREDIRSLDSRLTTVEAATW